MTCMWNVVGLCDSDMHVVGLPGRGMYMYRVALSGTIYLLCSMLWYFVFQQSMYHARSRVRGHMVCIVT